MEFGVGQDWAGLRWAGKWERELGGHKVGRQKWGRGLGREARRAEWPILGGAFRARAHLGKGGIRAGGNGSLEGW